MAEAVYNAFVVLVTGGAVVVMFAAAYFMTRTDQARAEIAETRRTLSTVGIRPNQTAPAPRCRHDSPPEPVEVHDRLDGRPEVVAWLCPDCYELTRPPPPPGRGGISTAEAAQSMADLGLIIRTYR